MRSIIEWNTDLKSAPTNMDLLVLHDTGIGPYITIADHVNPGRGIWISGEYQLHGIKAWAMPYTELEMEIIE